MASQRKYQVLNFLSMLSLGVTLTETSIDRPANRDAIFRKTKNFFFFYYRELKTSTFPVNTGSSLFSA